MGFLDTSTVSSLPVFYNVVHAVGKNCPNMRDDVKLIQYLFMSLYEKGSLAPGWDKPPGEMKVTGFCGPTTISWILDFQMKISKQSPGCIVVDGRMDRVRNKDFVGSISRTYYAISWLNSGVKKFNPDAFVMAPNLIPLENPMNISPPSNDMVYGSSVGGA